MVGAEKLLGKGDMLFYPQNYQKPARCRVHTEVSDVVEFYVSQGAYREQETQAQSVK